MVLGKLAGEASSLSELSHVVEIIISCMGEGGGGGGNGGTRANSIGVKTFFSFLCMRIDFCCSLN